MPASHDADPPVAPADEPPTAPAADAPAGGPAAADVVEVVASIELDLVEVAPIEVDRVEVDPAEEARPAAPRWSRAPRLDLSTHMTGAEAFAAIVAHSLQHFAANEECARRNLHVEGVHQCRIALRRLRAALQIFRPLLERGKAAPIHTELRWLAGVLGAARDLDIVETELLAPTVAGLSDGEPAAALLATLKANQAAAYAAVAEALGSPRHRALVADLTRLARDGRSGRSDDAEQPLVGFAAHALSRVYAKLLRKAAGFELLSAAERHEARIALKRLRYALDFFVNLFDGRSKKKFIRKVTRLQDDLGRMNDLSVARGTLGRLVESCGSTDGAASAKSLAFVAGGILGWHQASAAEAERRLVKDWYAFAGVKPFWLGHI
ncbi:CHAD domain-containing protein [Xanthobacteraceae bacterium Astr-EGSB]|uniref:CHAD domain-containing protein n=1 Tax=Astrobacterium formosum TaxID=3069710 RepID=UPI0027AFB7DB|nr:CHAD domain-containing protein [Xanthobacteraceae bacterium Astr-EGSB]